MQVLIVTPEDFTALATLRAVKEVDLRQVTTLDEARRLLQQTTYDVLMVMLEPPLMQLQAGLTLASQVKQQSLTTRVVLFATDPTVVRLVEVLRSDMSDYVCTGPSAGEQARQLLRSLVRRQTLRHAKIICTIGPASDSEETLAQLIEAGMDVARLNFSHGDHAWHRTVCSRIRHLSERVAIMADLQGPKLRIGSMQDERVVTLRPGNLFTLTAYPVDGTEERVSLDYPALPQEVQTGDILYLNDGLVKLCVLEVRQQTDIVCRVLTEGHISSRKGIHVPRAPLSARVPTARDGQDIRLAAALGVDFLAVSFVTEAEELRRVRSILHELGQDIPLISKIERALALENFPHLLAASDGIMVARGDLAVNIPAEDVPRYQKMMIRQCNQQGKPVICATQMLESMCHYPLPTRAEVSDVFNAILDGADAVMLSAESAAGTYPVETVRMMARIVRSAEATLPRFDPAAEAVMPSDILGHGISTMVERFTRQEERITAILAVTREGHSARMIAKYRPGVPIIAATSTRRVARQLLLSHGIIPMLLDEELADPVALTHVAILEALQRGHLSADDTVLTVSGSGQVPHEQTNFLGFFVVRDLLSN